jgi:beta-glucanase (GH16 family)
MKRHFFTIILALLLLIHTPAARSGDATPALPQPIAGQDYHLVKNWDFATNILDTDAMRREFYTRYASNNGTLDHLNDEWEVYRDHDNHEISNGALHLIARAPSGVLKAGSIQSGMIRSKWTGLYGYYEVRLKVPKGRGMWPAFWFATPVWPPEIDALEIVNNGDATTAVSFHNLHGKYVGKTLSSKLDKRDMYRPGFDYADGFHTFAIEWTPASVKHYVDNVLVVEREFEWRANNGLIAPASPVVINLAVGGSWPGAPTSLNEFPASLDVAYIRVWQR